MKATLEIPPKLINVFLGEADYRGAYGGRGSAKTMTFAKMSAVRGYQWAQAGKGGLILCGREFMNSLDESSMAEVKAAIISEPWLAAHYEIGEKFIRTKDRRIEYDFIGLRHNLDSIKSRAKIKLLWVDEGDPVTATAWGKAIPSVREEGSEIWITWNPERKGSATDQRFRIDPPARSKIVEMNWRDNPWFPENLDRKRLEDMDKRPEQYDHIWEGGYRTVFEGAYYAKALTLAKAENRICKLRPDPLMTYRAVWDIGGTGARADACSIWIVQYVGRELWFLDYYEAVGQPLAAHVAWLRESGYGSAQCILPHDGAQNDKVFDVSYQSALRKADFDVVVVPNQGRGAAAARIESARQMFNRCLFDDVQTEAGREALGAYHERRDEQRGIGLGPEHDWASHGADSFGLACIAYQEPGKRRRPVTDAKPHRLPSGRGSWMGA